MMYGHGDPTKVTRTAICRYVTTEVGAIVCGCCHRGWCRCVWTAKSNCMFPPDQTHKSLAAPG